MIKPDYEKTGRAHIRFFNCDCMEFMEGCWAKQYDLGILDPPYRDANQPTKQMRRKQGGIMSNFGQKPSQEYFDKLEKITENRIIWGGNNFIENLTNTNCMLFWYKKNPVKSFSDGEFAWTSFKSISQCIPITHFGAHTSDKVKTHPTQKPVALYRWLLKNYAKPGDTILDTHGGSMSIAIACWDYGFDLDICELDKDYFKAGVERFERHTAQLKLF